MAQAKVASLRSQLFARKGLARPASGFRVAAQADEEPEDSPWDGGAVPDGAAGAPAGASEESEPEPAASLARGGFSAADLDQVALLPVTGAPPRSAAAAQASTEAPRDTEAGPVPTDQAGEFAAAPADSGPVASQPVAGGSDAPERAVAAGGWLGGLLRDLRRDVLVVAGLAVLVAGGLAVGYQIGTVTRGGADGTAAGPATPAPAPTGEAADRSAPAADIQAPASDPASDANGETSAQREASASVSAPGPVPIGDRVPVAGTTAPTATSAAAPAAAEADSVPPDEVPRGSAAVESAPTPAEKPPSDATARAPDLYAVQLGSLPTRAGAQRVWERATEAQGPLFAGLELEVERAVLDGTPYYRARTGAFSDLDAAKAFCATLRGRGLDCLVVTK